VVVGSLPEGRIAEPPLAVADSLNGGNNMNQRMNTEESLRMV